MGYNYIMSKKLLSEYEKAAFTALETGKNHGCYIVVRIQQTDTYRLQYQEGRVETISYNPMSGVGIYAFTKKGHVAFGSTNLLTPESVRSLTNNLIQTAQANEKSGAQPAAEIYELKREDTPAKNVNYTPFSLNLIGEDAVLEIIREFDAILTKTDETARVKAGYVYEHEQWRILRTDGTDVSFAVPKCWLGITATISEGEEKTTFTDSVSAPDSESLVAQKQSLQACLQRSMAMGREQLSAEKIVGGNYPILMNHELVGLLAHEALGHPAESDAVESRASVLADPDGKMKTGEQVASEGVNITDYEPELAHGFYPYGSFGNARHEVTIIKDGILQESVSDVFSSGSTGVENKNCERSEGYYSTAMPRMSNTYVWLNEEKLLEPSVESQTPEHAQSLLAKHGIFSKYPEIIFLLGGRGGSVDPSSGNFMFGTGFSYKLTQDSVEPLKPVSFSGNVLEALKSIEFGMGQLNNMGDFGFCGKNGQRAHVNDGGNELLFFKPTKHVSLA